MAKDVTSPDVVELMDRSIDAVNRRDLEVLPRIFAADAVYDLSSVGLVIYEGLVAIRDLFEERWSLYDVLESEVEEIVDLLHLVAFVAIRQTGRPVGTTRLVRERLGWVMGVVDDMVVRVTVYADPDEARAGAERLAQERG